MIENFLIIWFVCGGLLAPFAYALTFSFFQSLSGKYAGLYYNKDLAFAIKLGLLTVILPMVLVAVITTCGVRSGLKWK